MAAMIVAVGVGLEIRAGLAEEVAAGEAAAPALAAAQLELRDADPASRAAAAGFTCLGS
jgi:hypothetical protein